MQKKEIIEKIIYPAFDEIRDMLDIPENLENKEDVVLIGKEALIDSMGLVSLLVAAEEKIMEITDKNITLANEKAMSRKNSPFKNVKALSDYIYELLDEK